MRKFESKFLTTLEERGFIQDCTDFVGLDKYFTECETSGKPATAYIGFDCTAASLHAGSLMQIMILRWLQKTGHKPIALLGGGTTKIGDPSGKDETRKILDDAAIETNKAGIKKVFDKYLNNYQLVDNSEWLEVNTIDFLRVCGRHFSVNKMLKFESVKRRLERDQELSFLEFNYMVMQAYDFVELDKKYGCRLQIGGSDQWGNIVCGTELHQKMKEENHRKNFIDKKKHEYPDLFKNNEKEFHKKVSEEYTLLYDIFGLTTPLLTTSSGAKMGKSSAGAIWLDAQLLSPNDYWQYWRNTDDKDVIKFLKLFTELSLEEIAELQKYEGSADINKAKIILANETTKMLHGEQASAEAEFTAKCVFENGGIGSDLPTVEVKREDLNNGISLAQIFSNVTKQAKSNGEAKKLIQGGGARLNDEKKDNIHYVVTSANATPDGIIKVSAGKKNHVIIRIVD